LPENWDVICLFIRVQTQWRVGMSGPVGLDYPAVFEVFRLFEVDNQIEVFQGLQVLEAKILNLIATEANKK